MNAYLKAHPVDEVQTLDIFETDLPAFDAPAVQAKYTILHGQEHTAAERKTWDAVEAVIEKFKTADKYLISAPMWNFGIPYRLKQYIDVVVQPGYTFSFSPETGYSGLVTDRPAMLFLARGGEYPAETEAAALDFQKPYLEWILKFIGFEQIDSIVVEPTLHGGPDVAAQKLEEAIAAAREKAQTF